MNYLVRRGIESKRIKWKGYGESALVNQCTDGRKCSKELHQQNRRAELMVTLIDEELHNDKINKDESPRP